jgi:lactate dehydrogenase-like 2-hydroxyacid dehydrogenase
MTDLPFVIVTHALPDGWLASLQGRCEFVTGPAHRAGLTPVVFENLAKADGMFTLLTDRVDEAVLTQAPRLRVISNMAVGVDNIDISACTRRGIPVGNTPGVLTAATADLAMALLLSIARNLPTASEDARLGRWKTWSPIGWLGADLNGSTLGIVGAGKIGRAVAQRARGFGARMVYTDSKALPDFENESGATFLPLDDLLKESDFVTLHVPLTRETYHLIGERELNCMKRSAYLVNTSRGPVVDTHALYQALAEGWIAGAALDVTDPEPLPPSHPLYRLPNCLVVPHIGSATSGTRRRMAELACQNLLAALEGQRMPHCANPQVYGG